MNIYAESSAVLSWLFGEPEADAVRDALDRATRVFASRLTGIECARTVHRAAVLGRITNAQAAGLLREYAEIAAGWEQVELNDDVFAAASGPFPVEPIRALDAIHLASAQLAGKAIGSVAIVSFDQRVRANADALGMDVLPVA